MIRTAPAVLASIAVLAMFTTLLPAPAAADVPISPVLGSEALLEEAMLRVEITDAVAVTHVHAVYRTLHDAPGTVRLALPLAPGGVLTAFNLTVNGTTYEGNVAEAGSARAAHDAASAAGAATALLESAGDGSLILRVHVPPGASIAVSATTVEVLPMRDGTRTWAFPLMDLVPSHPEWGPVHVELAASAAHGWDRFSVTGVPDGGLVEDGRSASLDVLVDGHAFEALRVAITPTSASAASTLLVSGHDADAYGVLVLTQEDGAPSFPKDVVLVLDVSGSMNTDDKIAQARDALHAVLDLLGPEDRFGLVSFATDVQVHREGLVPADAEHLAPAREWVDSLRAGGWTYISGAVHTGLGMLEADPERVPVLVLVTDGLPNRGIIGLGELVEAAGQWNTAAARLHTVGIGFDQDNAFLGGLAAAHRGVYRGLDWHDDAHAALEDLFTGVSQPVLRDVRLEVPDLGAHAFHPDPLPDLQAGSQLVAAARLDGSSLPRDVPVTVHGSGPDGQAAQRVLHVAADAVPVVPEAAKLWARQHAVTLEHRMGLATDPAQHEAARAALVELGVQYQVATQATSWVVTAPMLDLPLPEPSALPTDGVDLQGDSRHLGAALADPTPPQVTVTAVPADGSSAGPVAYGMSTPQPKDPMPESRLYAGTGATGQEADPSGAAVGGQERPAAAEEGRVSPGLWALFGLLAALFLAGLLQRRR